MRFTNLICLSLTVFVNCHAMLVPLPDWAVKTAFADRDSVRTQFLLVKALLHDFVHLFSLPSSQTTPVESSTSAKTITPSDDWSTEMDTETSTTSEMPSMSGINELLKNFPIIANNHPEIANHFAYSTINEDSWMSSQERLTKIVDSWGRPPAGLHSTGPFFWLGAYDQCLSIDETQVNQTLQYCRADLRLTARGLDRPIPLFYGICLPSICNEQNLRQSLNLVSQALMTTMDIIIDPNSTIECQQNIAISDRFTIAHYITLTILGTLCFLVLAGTFLDLYVRRRQRTYSCNNTQSVVLRMNRMKTSNNKSIPSENSSHETPFVQDDCKSFIYTDAPSLALTYKSALALKRTLKRRGCITNALRAFSVRLTYHHLTRSSERQLDSLHGIRVLSAFWVVVGHAHLLSLEYVGNVRQMWRRLQKVGDLSQLVFNSSLAVDSFLLASACVLAYSIRCRIQRTHSGNRFTALPLVSWLLFYVHRITRLTPAFLLVTLIVHYLLPLIGDGPMWSQDNGIFGTRCNSSNMWQQMLYLSNFFPSECMPWMWYLALDTQYYIVSPIIMLILYNNHIIGIAFIVGTVILSVLYRITVIIIFNLPTTLLTALIASEGLLATESLKKMFILFYAAPQSRAAPFLIGLLLGWWLSRRQKRYYSIIYIDFMRISALILMLFSLFGANYANCNYIFGVFYGSTFRVFWAVGLSLLIWLSERGYLKPIYSFLSWKKWTVLSRLCFGFYLTHEPISLYYIWSRREAITPLSPFYFIIFAIEMSVLSMIAAFLIALVVEVPPLTIERKLFKTIRARQLNRDRFEEFKKDDTKNARATVLNFKRISTEKSPESLPVLPPINRTKRWIEDCHESINKSRNTISEGVSTCKSLSEENINSQQTNDQSFDPVGQKQQRQLHHQKQQWQQPRPSQGEQNAGLNTHTDHHIPAFLIQRPVNYKLTKPVTEIGSSTFSKLESDKTTVGFSWIEAMAKKLDDEDFTTYAALRNQKRVPLSWTTPGKHIHSETVPLTADDRTSSTKTVETVIQIGKRDNGESES